MGNARIAVVGAGWWACEFHIPHVLENPNAEIVCVSRLGKEELEKIRESFGIPHITENHQEVYSFNPDGVIVASPTCYITSMLHLHWNMDVMSWWKNLW